jgi:hypothetical protein
LNDKKAIVNFPISGLILLPCSLAVFAFAPARLSEWAVFVAIFQAAAIINLSGGFVFGLAPYFLAALLIAARTVPQWLSRRIRFARNEPALMHIRSMALFVGWTTFSAFALPVLFAGTPVDDPRAGVDVSYYFRMPLHWSFSNAGQAAYMLLNFLVILHMLQMSERPHYIERLQRIFSFSGACVVMIGAYQMICGRTGLSYPTWLFNSNAAWAQLSNQYFNGINRVTATFPEPSSTATFLSAWILFELTIVVGRRLKSAWRWACLIGGTIVLMETASTTGYLTVGAMCAVICWTTLKTVLTRGRLNVKAMLAMSIAIVGAAGVLATVPDARSFLDGVLFNKLSSGSAIHRTATLGRAVGVFVDTLTLGAGLGSNRATSLFFYVLSNLGCPGVILLCCLLVQFWSQYSRCIRGRASLSVKIFVRASGAAFAATLLAMMFGGAEITVPHLWILWGMLAAGLRHAWLLDNRRDEVVYLDPSSIVSEEPPGHDDLTSNDVSDTPPELNTMNHLTFATR